MARSTNGSSDYITCGSLPWASNAAQVTVALWMYRATTGTTAGCGTYLLPNKFSIIHFSDDNIYVNGDDGAVGAYNYYTQAVAGWNHYAAVFDGAQSVNADRMRLYFNGVLLARSGFNGSFGSTIGSTGNPAWRFGMDAVPGDRFWAGAYAETAVWDVALTAAEVTALYWQRRSPLTMPRKPRHYWPILGQGVEPDLVGANHGTLVGTTTVADPWSRVGLHRRRVRRGDVFATGTTLTPAQAALLLAGQNVSMNYTINMPDEA